MTTRRPRGIALALLLGYASCLTPAAALTWDGGANSPNWGALTLDTTVFPFVERSNWSGNHLPDPLLDNLVFAGTRGLVNNNDRVSRVNALSFAADAGAFVMGGFSVLVDGSITNASSSHQTINMPIIYGAGQVARWDGGPGGITINGRFSIADGLESFSLQVKNGIKFTDTGPAFVVQAGQSLSLQSGSTIKSNAAAIGVAANTQTDYLFSDIVLSGGGTQWANSTLFTVGGSTGFIPTRVDFQIENGARVSSKDVDLLEGSATRVTGGGAQFINAGTVRVGGDLSIANGAAFSALALNVYGSGVVAFSGGTMTLGSGDAGPGVFSWTGGTLNLTNPAGAVVGQGVLANQQLTTGKRLNVTGALTVGSGSALVLAGGQISAERIDLNGGAIVATVGSIDLATAGDLTGHGTVAAAVTGGAGRAITVSGGALTLGDLGRSNGFAFNGRLDIGSNQALLLSAGKAELGTVTTLGQGGSLNSVNGILLAASRTLTFDGDASIQGRFTNAGTVAGASGALTMLGDVDGAGAFSGHVIFRAGYSPGNSAVAANFAGGSASFDSFSMLTMEIFGPEAGAQYDQLLGLQLLDFNGKLSLVFDAGYQPVTGSQFALFDFDEFQGAFAADRIEVVGFDRGRLDFSELAQSGTLSVMAVPEAPTTAMWILGLGSLCWRVSRSGRRRCGEDLNQCLAP